MEGPEMVLPDSLKSDVVVFRRGPIRNFRPLPPLEFLPYRVSHLKRGLSWEEIWNLFDVRVDAQRDPRSFSFTLLEDDTEKWEVACRWTRAPRTVSARIAGGLFPASIVISHQCHLSPAGSDQRWTLNVETSGAAESASKESQSPGRLTDGKVVYEVSPSYAEDAMFGIVPLAGYLFIRAQDPVAAATTNFRTQRLIVRNSIASENRSLIAAAAYALLLIPEKEISP
jgi:hypothetical protein